MQNAIAPYNPRNPRLSDYYRCVEDYFEELERVHEERYQSRFGYLRTEIRSTIFRYLDCGCLQNGFARVKCNDCGHEYLVAFSCKRRHFCPSCHQKRVVEFGEWFLEDLAVTVPHRHIIFSIPKLIRRCFLFDRKLLAALSRIVWETLKEYTSTLFGSAQDRSLSAGGSLPGCACSIQTFGDFLGFNPHCHIIISDGTFDEAGNFRITPYYDARALEELFRHKLLKMLLNKGAISQWHIDLLMSWQHSGFNVHICEPIAADDRQALEKLAHYIIRCQFSQERMTYLEESGTVIYRSKDGQTTKSFSALDWLAMIISHIPRHGEQMVRYYGWYSNAARGRRRKQGVLDDKTPEITGQEQDTGYRRKCRANWSRLIQKIYGTDPLTCPNCNGTMRILAFIEEAVVIRKILDHLGLWDVPKRQPKQGRGPPMTVKPALSGVEGAEPQLEYADSQLIEYEEAYYEPDYLS